MCKFSTYMKKPLRKKPNDPMELATSNGDLHLAALRQVPVKSTATFIIKKTIRIRFHLKWKT